MSTLDPRRSVSYSPIVRAAMNLHYTLQTSMKDMVPTPRDTGQYRWHGRAHRVLLVGNGSMQGWGVFTHGYALTGQLGMMMYDRLGVPVNVDSVGEELMSIETITDWVHDVQLEQYDAIVVMTGLNDALRMTPAVTWAKSLQRFLNELRERCGSDVPILGIGIEPIEGVIGYNPIVGYIAQAHADLLNDLLRKQLSGDNEHYMEVSARTADYSRGPVPADTYRPWAEQIATVLTPLMPQREPKEDQSTEVVKFNWAGAPRALGRDGRPVPTRLTEIEQIAKKKFGVYLAQINLIDNGRQWVANHTGPVPSSVPAALTYCGVAATQSDILVVPNSNKDERFKDNPYLKQAHMPFYAGKALYSREGEAVATFCLLDIMPRPKVLLNQRSFNKLWEEAQTEIWRIEDEANGIIPMESILPLQLEAGKAATPSWLQRGLLRGWDYLTGFSARAKKYGEGSEFINSSELFISNH
jgi:GAF domain-containing protein